MSHKAEGSLLLQFKLIGVLMPLIWAERELDLAG